LTLSGECGNPEIVVIRNVFEVFLHVQDLIWCITGGTV
jgi:hypothetical protein